MADSDKSIHQFPNGTLTEGSLFVTADEGQGTTYVSAKHAADAIAMYMLGSMQFNNLQSEDKSVFGAINELSDVALDTILSGTLTAGQTTISFSHANIDDNSLISYYTEPFGINPTNITQSGHTVTLAFAAQQSDVKVSIAVKGYAGGGGGGSSEPQFSSTKICDNSSLTNTLTFTGDYTTYDFLKVVLYNSSTTRYTEIITTPEMITNAFTYSNNLINFNEVANDQYICYSKTNNTSWSRYNRRNLDVYEIYGMNCINKTVQKTTIYNRQGIGSSSVSVTSATSLFDYDYLFEGSCTSNADETQPCNEFFKVPDDIFGRTAETRTMCLNAYNKSVGAARMSEYEISSWGYHFFIQGIKFV